MTKPVLFLDANTIIALFGSGTPNTELGARALSELSQI